MGSALSALPEKQLLQAVKQLTNWVVRVLKELDGQGVFGSTGERDNYVVNLVMDDQSRADVLATAKRLNPLRVYARLKKELTGTRRAAPPDRRPENVPATTAAQPPPPANAGDYEVMEPAYDKRGGSSWHAVRFMPALADMDALKPTQPLLRSWTPLKATIEREKATPDIYVSSRTVVSEKALAVLRPFLGDSVEALPLALPKAANDVAPLFVLHQIGGGIAYGDEEGLGEAKTLLFHKRDIAGRHYFEAYVHKFVSAELHRAIEQAGLRGVVFRKQGYGLRE
jgi:hypothetical protein